MKVGNYMTKRSKLSILILIIFLSILFSACSDADVFEEDHAFNGEDLRVHYIDVGQGDAILIQKDHQNMLIDAGDNKYEQLMVDYLKGHGVSKVDFLIATHPHADHIGGMDAVIKNFDIGTIIMPKVAHNSKTFEDVLLAIKEKGLKVNAPKIAEAYELGDARWTILAPNSEIYENFNNYSVVVKLEYGNKSFLFTGDAENLPEEEMLARHGNLLSSNVLKVGHHGSNSSTTEEFLEVVHPEIAVIQLAKDNKYGHPHSEVMERLEDYGVDIYRNDIHGNIIINSDRNTINVNVQVKQTLNQEKDLYNKKKKKNIQYIGNKNSKVLHLESCDQLQEEKNRVYFSNRKEALEKDFKPCQRCKP